MDGKPDPITCSIAEFRRLSGIFRSKIYELLAAGELESVHVGVRRLVLLASYRGLIERQRKQQQHPIPAGSETRPASRP